MIFVISVLIIVSVFSTLTSAQTPSFEVASIKANKSGDNSMFVNILPGGRFMARNATLRELVQAAYQFQYQAFQILGGAGWIDTERFNIDAKADGTFSPAQVSAMVQRLLADRFHLVLRNETQQLPTYALVVARSDARLGSQLRTAAGGCVSAPLGRGAPASAEANPPPRCGLHFDSGRDNGLRMTGDGVTMQQLAERLQFYVQRVVVDDTKLKGKFDLALEFTPDRRRPAGADAAGPAQDSGLSIITALQDQLGLRLNTQRGDVKVLVIEGAERPAEN